MNVLELIIMGVGFLGGVSIIPLVAYLGGGALWAFIAEPLANALIIVACFATGPARLHQREDDTYELRPADDVEGPARKWERWAMTKFCYTYENTREAWGHLVADVDLKELDAPDDLVNTPVNIAKSNITRGDQDWYVDTEADGLRIRVGAALNRLKGPGHLEMATETLSEGLKEHGGDTSSVGVKWQAGGFALFTFVGLAMGWVLFL